MLFICPFDSIRFTHSYFNDTMPSSMSLDYIPALRNIAFMDRVAKESFEMLKLASTNNEIFAERPRRRTRNKGSYEYEHYFKNLISTNSDANPKETGEIIANMKLICT